MTSKAEWQPPVSLPEILCDLNAAYSANRYSSTCWGTTRDLERLGLTAERALGMPFLFNSGDDANPAGDKADIMFCGTFVRTAEHGIVIQMDQNGVFWRSHKDGTFSR
jgi:hypothetical protein